MRHLYCVVICLLIFAGCISHKPASHTAGSESTVSFDAVAELNRQIDKFNAGRPGVMGITPITQRVSRVEYSSDRDALSSFDQSGNLFLILKRQRDSSFKGTLKVKFEKWAKPDSHLWGEVAADFMLPGKILQQN